MRLTSGFSPRICSSRVDIDMEAPALLATITIRIRRADLHILALRDSNRLLPGESVQDLLLLPKSNEDIAPARAFVALRRRQQWLGLGARRRHLAAPGSIVPKIQATASWSTG